MMAYVLDTSALLTLRSDEAGADLLLPYLTMPLPAMLFVTVVLYR